MTDGAQKDGIELSQLVGTPLRKRLASLQIALAAPIEMGQLVLEAFQRRDRAKNLERLGRHFRAGAIAADDGDLECRSHAILSLVSGPLSVAVLQLTTDHRQRTIRFNSG